jgi:hypothetical protein
MNNILPDSHRTAKLRAIAFGGKTNSEPTDLGVRSILGVSSRSPPPCGSGCKDPQAWSSILSGLRKFPQSFSKEAKDPIPRCADRFLAACHQERVEYPRPSRLHANTNSQSLHGLAEFARTCRVRRISPPHAASSEFHRVPHRHGLPTLLTRPPVRCDMQRAGRFPTRRPCCRAWVHLSEKAFVVEC